MINCKQNKVNLVKWYENILYGSSINLTWKLAKSVQVDQNGLRNKYFFMTNSESLILWWCLCLCLCMSLCLCPECRIRANPPGQRWPVVGQPIIWIFPNIYRKILSVPYTFFEIRYKIKSKTKAKPNLSLR